MTWNHDRQETAVSPSKKSSFDALILTIPLLALRPRLPHTPLHLPSAVSTSLPSSPPPLPSLSLRRRGRQRAILVLARNKWELAGKRTKRRRNCGFEVEKDAGETPGEAKRRRWLIWISFALYLLTVFLFSFDVLCIWYRLEIDDVAFIFVQKLTCIKNGKIKNMVSTQGKQQQRRRNFFT